MREIIVSVGHRKGTSVIDVQGLFEDRSPGKIPGNELLIDHVHPTIQGHQLIADAILREMVRQSIIKPTSDWETKRNLAYQDHLKGLDEVYFDKRKDRLDALRRWTKGREEKVRSNHSQNAIGKN
jgi:hypothetical protein